MPTDEVEEFGELLIRHVRDQAIRECDQALRSTATTAHVERWRQATASPSGLGMVLPEIVDFTLFYLLEAVDNGHIRLRFTSRSGREIDLGESGLGVMASGYMSSGSWRGRYSSERVVDEEAGTRT